MEVVYRCCCGIDVHKNLVVACLRKGGGQELREFGTMTGEIKVLEGANIKLGNVVADICSKSARRLLERLVAGETMDDSEKISKPPHKSLLPKLDEIVASLDGIVTPLQRALLAQILNHIGDLDRRILELNRMAETYMAEFQPAIAESCQMPGIAQRSAEVILADTGVNMLRFPSAAHLCSWAGVCPGNHQSAGKWYHGKTRKGNQTLKSMLVQCAKAASKVKGSYFAAQYQRIAARREKNRATMAHSMLIALYHILRDGVPFHDLGADYFDGFHREHKIRSYLKRL